MKRRSGQAILEAALVLPCLLVLLAGVYVACRSASPRSAAESAAFAQLLREGRRQPGIREKIAGSLLPGGRGALLHTERKRAITMIPSFLPSLEGRTRCTAQVRKDWKEAGRIASWPSLEIAQAVEASVDCWEKQTPSGNKTSRAVRAYVIARSIR